MPNYDKLFARAQKQLSMGDMDNALATLSKCVKSKPYKLRCLSAMGNVYGQLARYDEAAASFKQAVRLDKRDHELWCQLAMAMVFSNQSQSDILVAFKESIKLNNKHAKAWYGAGSVYRDMGLYSEAKIHLSEAISIDDRYIDARINLATIFRYEGDFEKALTEYDACIKIHPNNADAIAGKSLTLFYRGEIAEAENLIISLAGKSSVNPMVAQAYCEICKRGSNAHDALSYISKTLVRQDVAPVEKSNLYYAAARLCDILGEYDSAYMYAESANKYIGQRLDIASYQATLSRSKALAILPVKIVGKNYNADVQPIFILGMPRSGSTLVEQVLSCHPDITAGGELTNLHDYITQATHNNIQLNSTVLFEIGKKYIKDLFEISGGRKYVTDKLPGNFEKIGYINAMFPNAKIIHTDRNKLDVCISCFFQNFGTRHSYVCDKKALIITYQFYIDVLSHWREHSIIDIYDVSYESLINDNRTEIKNLLAYLDLPWSEGCIEQHKSSRIANTASFDQVRQPLYNSSIGRWKNYERHILDLIEALGCRATQEK